MSKATADLWDEHTNALTLLNLDLLHYGLKTAFCGQIVTLKVFEDNTKVRHMLSQNGKGKVLVIDGGGSKRCALIGDNIAQLAIDNHWEGILVYGCIRDSKVISEMNVGIKAIGTCPVKSIKRNEGQAEICLIIEGTEINHGAFAYADEDGVLISDLDLK